jgi:hypothetical protein
MLRCGPILSFYSWWISDRHWRRSSLQHPSSLRTTGSYLYFRTVVLTPSISTSSIVLMKADAVVYSMAAFKVLLCVKKLFIRRHTTKLPHVVAVWRVKRHGFPLLIGIYIVPHHNQHWMSRMYLAEWRRWKGAAEREATSVPDTCYAMYKQCQINHSVSSTATSLHSHHRWHLRRRSHAH